VMAQGASGLGLARSLLSKASRRNGHEEHDPAEPAASNGTAVVARLEPGAKE